MRGNTELSEQCWGSIWGWSYINSQIYSILRFSSAVLGYSDVGPEKGYLGSTRVGIRFHFIYRPKC